MCVQVRELLVSLLRMDLKYREGWLGGVSAERIKEDRRISYFISLLQDESSGNADRVCNWDYEKNV